MAGQLCGERRTVNASLSRAGALRRWAFSSKISDKPDFSGLFVRRCILLLQELTFPLQHAPMCSAKFSFTVGKSKKNVNVPASPEITALEFYSLPFYFCNFLPRYVPFVQMLGSLSAPLSYNARFLCIGVFLKILVISIQK